MEEKNVKKVTEATKAKSGVATAKRATSKKNEENLLETTPKTVTVKKTSGTKKATTTKKETTTPRTGTKKVSTVTKTKEKNSAAKTNSNVEVKKTPTKKTTIEPKKVATTKKQTETKKVASQKKVSDNNKLNTVKLTEERKKTEKIKPVTKTETIKTKSIKQDKIENKLNIEDLDKKIKEQRFVSNKEKVLIIKSAFYNLVYAFVFILYLVFCNYGFYNIKRSAMTKNIHLFSFIFLGVAILLFESAYKEDKLKKCINGIETLIIGFFSLIMPYILQIYTWNYTKILNIFGISIFVYYVVKSTIVFVLNRRRFLINKDNIVKDKMDNEFE